MTNDVLAKPSLIGEDLDTYSLETVKSFSSDGAPAAVQALIHFAGSPHWLPARGVAPTSIRPTWVTY